MSDEIETQNEQKVGYDNLRILENIEVNLTVEVGSAELKIAPPVAMVGRVPVRTIGRVQKGDRLVSAGNGCAMAANYSSTAVIGRALESKETETESLVEAVVKVNI